MSHIQMIFVNEISNLSSIVALKFKRLSSVKIQSVNFKIYFIFDKKSLFIANCVFYFVHIRYILLLLIRVIALFSWQ